MKKLFLSTVAIIGLVTIGWGGGDVQPPQEPPTVIDNWSGPYIGAQFGYIKGKGDVRIIDPSNFTVKPSGAIAGVFGGYNWLSPNNLLFGIEADISAVSADKKKVFTEEHSIHNEGTILSTETYKLKQNWDASIRLRAGKIFQDKYLPYVTVGATWAGVEASSITRTGTTKEKKTLSGWTAGAGVAMKINEYTNVRIQYRYSKYSKKRFRKVGPTDLKYKTNSIELGVSYKFN